MTMTIEEKRLAETRKFQQRKQKQEYEWAYSVFKTWKEGDPDNIFKSASTEDNLKELFGGDENEEREIARILESWMSESFASLIPSEAEKQLEAEWQRAEDEAQKKADESLAKCREIDPYEPVLPPEEESFIQKWQSISKDIIKVEVHSNEDEYELFNRFKVFYGSIRDYIQKSNAEIKRRESIQKQLPQVLAFFEELTELSKQYISHFDEIRFSQKWKNTTKNVAKVDVRSSDDEYEKFTSLKRIWNSFHDYVQKSNVTFIQNEFKRCDKLLSDIDGKSLDTQQRTAVINDEDRILVLAGAGSGKTLTIAAKVKYLCEERSVNPNEILLISFTKKSAQEMTDRIRNKLGIEIEAKTFHKLGLDIISRADGARPEVSDESGLNTFIHDFFEKELINYPDLIKALTEYFAYYLEIPEDIEDYDSLGELYQEEKNADLETIKSKYEQERYIRDNGADKAKALTTLNNEKVKSLEETKIANFLFLNGIKYEYERVYPFETGDPMRKVYRPDFYLTDYDIYLEHFGVNKDLSAPWLS